MAPPDLIASIGDHLVNEAGATGGPIVDGDYGFRGFFALRTPQDLLAKLRHDHARLADNPIDSYAAFDFFVTANHLVDWIWPSATHAQQRDNRRTETIPRICEHLADGAKHFLLDHPHQGVADAAHTDGAFDPAICDPKSFDVGELVVILEPAEAADIGQSRISALALATIVLAYWSRRIGS
jgi:hypothetical protein